jgi:hypothetical protein
MIFLLGNLERKICSSIIAAIFVMLFSTNESFAERERDYHISLGANLNNYGVINIGIMDQLLGGLNDHLDLTLIHSPNLDYIPGIDVGVGWAFFRVGGVFGAYQDSRSDTTKAFGAIYPEIWAPLYPVAQYFNLQKHTPYLNTRYYITSQGANFFTLGIGVVWDPSP